METIYLKRINGMVHAYKDINCLDLFCKWGKDITQPNRRRKQITVNCWAYNCVWL